MGIYGIYFEVPNARNEIKKGSIHFQKFVHNYIQKLIFYQRDAIVNTTSLNLDLDSGKVSRSILRKAGRGIQDQLRNFHPKGIAPGEVAVTRGFSLDCRFVYHGALDYWPSTHDPEVKKTHCLEVVHDLHANKIIDRILKAC